MGLGSFIKKAGRTLKRAAGSAAKFAAGTALSAGSFGLIPPSVGSSVAGAAIKAAGGAKKPAKKSAATGRAKPQASGSASMVVPAATAAVSQPQPLGFGFETSGSGMDSSINTVASASGLPMSQSFGTQAPGLDLGSLIAVALKIPSIVEMFKAVASYFGFNNLDAAYQNWPQEAYNLFAKWIRGDYDRLPNLPYKVNRNQLAMALPFMPPVIDAPVVSVRRAPPGYAIVTLNGNTVAMRKDIARSQGLWKPRRKAPILASEYQALKTADRVDRKIKSLNKLAGLRVPTAKKK